MQLINWNVQWGRDASGRVDLGRTVAEARALADFDVLCLQELTRGFDSLPGGPGADQFAELAALLPGYTVIEALAVDLPPDPGQAAARAPRRQFGNAIATRLPVGRILRHTLPWPADDSVPSMPRVALEANLQTAHGPLRVVTTHLEFYSGAQRMAQIEALREQHREALDHARHPASAEKTGSAFTASARARDAVVCGDFNSAWRDDAYRRLLAPIDGAPAFVDAWMHAHPGETPPPTAGIYDTQQWQQGSLTCDFVFVTETLRERILRCEIDSTTRASDHQPILLELRD
ncbi:endonuclease/exonuclease/phosphatase family protein [Burkholderia gladioli]|uniref:endonuclease/exonuclease/phosphatase family protein n=1 Tax=Burkholderia TaxID=32008 RepID=UPI00119BDBD6|nr:MULTISPECIES: endonuclease/exonuclease/phosphatase family protein [Burkholderia]MDN7494921.1 endonuclease/exonuclease/phosphatase family protein [Burkholderia gladioli]MDN7599837.1 endonuclease/exonuclease/phosphatase family protein [Burkholderia gladioli]MDN7738641.1 endonuclease/exonuclease/phosphatase family protein [Burkholderia gladioli]TWC74176.1 endonuclease/exonuclease/phosphatase family metal-dependent hydrolase [Burkholderia sp. SJZ089]TWD04026.1 endonuclease/exonuclease/phosphata